MKLEVWATLSEKELPPKEIQIKIHNAGVGRNDTQDARRRLQADVLDRNPTLSFFSFESAILPSTSRSSRPPISHVYLKQCEINLRYFITVLK